MVPKYLENAIPARDLVAFAAENAEDVNKLTRQFRDVMKLKVNVVQVDPNSDPERMQPSSEVNVPDFKGMRLFEFIFKSLKMPKSNSFSINITLTF